MNTKLRTEAKPEFEKDFFKWMSNVVFGKTMKNVRIHRCKPCYNIKKEELCGVRTKLAHNKVAFINFISNRNEKISHE